MSFHVFFAFSMGLAEPIQAPKGTLKEILCHIQKVEVALHLVRATTMSGELTNRWDSWKRDFSSIDNKVLCETVREHNNFVRRFYHNITRWKESPPKEVETITPEDAQTFWHGLEILEVPVQQWTPEYYIEEMEVLYEVMRGRETDGMNFESEPLTPQQAGEVINLFCFLDPDDRRLMVPRGCDHLASSYDGGYDWCDRCCEAIAPDDPCDKKDCPVRDHDEEEEE